MSFKVEVVYASADKQQLVSVDFKPGMSAQEAIRASGLLEVFPEIQLDEAEIGVFSQKIALNDLLEAGDRVEIYRPLLVDPKDRRRQRAQ